MSQVYTKDKNVRVSFRLDGKLSAWLLKRSEEVGMTPSAFLRSLAFQTFYTETVLEGIGSKKNEQNRKVAQDEHIQALQHD